MSPPTKATPEPQLDQKPAHDTERPTHGEARRSGTALAAPHAAVIAGQQTAGNRAVAAALTGAPGVQRAPADDDPLRTSGMAHAPTLDSSGGAATAPTLPGAGTAASGGGPGPAGGGGQFNANRTMAGEDDDFGRRSGELPDAGIAAAYRANPKKVYRAETWNIYERLLAVDKIESGNGYPRGYRSGGAVIVAPDYDGPGPPPRVGPIPDQDEELEPEEPTVRMGGGGIPVPGDPRGAKLQGPAGPDLSDPNARRAIFPGSRRGPEPGMKPAVPVTHDEVMKAYRDNPGSVHPSRDDDWHNQVYDVVDRGQGQVPRAYRSGNTIIVDPSYPLDGRPPDASPVGSRRTPGPGADLATVVNPVQIPSNSAGTAQAGVKERQEESKVERPIPKAMSTIAPAPINPELEGDIPRNQTVRHDDDSPDIEIDSEERKPAKWGVKGANVTRASTTEKKRTTRRTTEATTNTGTFSAGTKGAGHEWQQRDEVRTDDKVVGREKSTKVNVNLEGLAITTGRSTDEGKGEAADPADPGAKGKTRTNVQAGGTIGPSGVGGTGTASIESKTGAKAEATGNVKFGPDSIEVGGTAGFTTAKGFTGHLSVSGKNRVVAADPRKLENGKFSVTFTVTDEKGVQVGGGWSKPGGGASASLNVGSSTSTAQFETRVFDSEPEAKLFQLTAAFRVSHELDSIRKATSAAGALEMKEGESRGSSETNTDTVGGSVGMGGADVGVGTSDATTRGLTIKKVGPTTVRVTPSVSERKALDASISAWGAAGNTKGESEINAFAVTYEFDLGSEAGKNAFEDYCKNRFPPPMPPLAKWIDSTTGRQIEDHDVYKFAHIGEIGYQNTAWQQTVVDESGTHAAAGGGQSHKVDLNWVRHLTLDENVHSEVEIAGRLENGKTAGFAGQMTVGGESGSYNRDAFREIFIDTRPAGGTKATNSGEWTLSADIDAKMFEQLEQVNADMRKAKTREEKLKIYSELAKKNGARMLGGQVRGSGSKLAWNLELKGDPNFPGPAGRARLEDQRAKLAEQLTTKPDSAGTVAREAKETIEALHKRLTAVGDEKKYTDLPDELRKEQVDLINHHVSQFESLRSQALSLAMRGGQNESVDEIRKRAEKPHGYDDVRSDQREVKKLRDSVQLKEADIAVIAREIQGTHRILGRMMTDKGVRLYRDEHSRVHPSVAADHTARARTALGQARSMDERLKASAAKARELRKQWDAGGDPQAWLQALRALDAELKEQKGVAKLELEYLQDAVREAYIITTDEAIGKDWAYFASIKVDSAARSIAISGLTDDDL